MRSTLNEIIKRDFKFVIELDAGGEGTEYICWVYTKYGECFYKNDGHTQVRKYFKKLDNKYINNFCNKFATDNKYRESYR